MIPRARNLKKLVKRLLAWSQGGVAPLSQRYPKHEFGRWTYGDDLQVRSWNEGAQLRVGSFTSIASGVQIFLGGEHRVDWVTTFPFNVFWPAARDRHGHPKTKGDVTVGSDVWIGSEAVILSGVTIGDGAVVGARAVVARDVPPYAIVAGNPARVLRLRFEPRVVERLLATAWWKWDDNVIARAMSDLLNTDIEQFLRRAEARDYQSVEHRQSRPPQGGSETTRDS